MSFMLIVANGICLTVYEPIALDGAIKKAYNSHFNMIKEKTFLC